MRWIHKPALDFIKSLVNNPSQQKNRNHHIKRVCEVVRSIRGRLGRLHPSSNLGRPTWECSAVGSIFASKAKGREFESYRSH